MKDAWFGAQKTIVLLNLMVKKKYAAARQHRGAGHRSCFSHLCHFVSYSDESESSFNQALQAFVRASLDYGLFRQEADIHIPTESPADLELFRVLADDHYGVLLAATTLCTPPMGKVVVVFPGRVEMFATDDLAFSFPSAVRLRRDDAGRGADVGTV